MVKVIKEKQNTAHVMPAFLRVLLSVLFLLFLAAIYTWYIFWRQNLGDSGAVDEFMKTKPELFMYSYIIVALIVLLIAAVTWRPFFTAGLVFSIISGIMYAHMQKYTVRKMPLLPEDFRMAGQLGGMMEFVDIWEIVRLVAGIILILAGSGLAEHFARKIFGRKTAELPWWEKCSLIPRVTLSMIVLTIVVLVSGPVIREKKQGDDAISWLEGVDCVAWDQAENYRNNGFVIGFLYNLGSLQTEEPEGYSEERVAQILEKYEKVKKLDTGRKPLEEVVDNLIFVMNESFFDPDVFGEIYAHSGGDLQPNLHKIFQKYPSGYMYSPEYGGNTANVEFEGYTSLTNYWSGSIPYVNSVSKISNIPSIVSYTKANGFVPTAIHAYDGSMYKRNFVYANMGFNEFIDMAKMTHTEKENGKGYIKDSEVYAEILDVLNDGEEKHMVGAVTMQNHAPYDSAEYETLNFTIKNPNISIARHNAESSFESLHNADKYLGEFIDKLDKLEGRTVMIWFGDHAAGVLDDLVLSGSKEEIDLTHLTPYFIYANFDLENTLTVKEVTALNQLAGFEFETKGVDLPTVTPNCLANTLYDALGVEKPALVYLTAKVCEEVPILAPTYLGDDGPKVTDAVKDYQMINYDILNGKRYALR